ncbi:hypothetical protein [Sulfuriflexus sp.]|uniref:hypothetical protein n=1 Tax=Sulfuriflexus sp. TaxID=2015443 RepID=UPI0028CBFFB9|nr:hypothetical protein [Sulfuriflexus sp.]MDT8403856.1 hypothetical protein [Sulfuriflexus sp.]
MKTSLPLNGSISLALLLHSGLVSAEQPFTAHEIESRPGVADCRIFEFTCATCGHMLDSEQWDAQNRLISDVEACAKQQAEQADKAPSDD